jgi:hypothetical protein
VLGAGCWVLGAGCWVLGAGCWVLGAGCWVLGAGCWAEKANHEGHEGSTTAAGGARRFWLFLCSSLFALLPPVKFLSGSC